MVDMTAKVYKEKSNETKKLGVNSRKLRPPNKY